MTDIDKTTPSKIPCGDLPERYPRTNAKKYRDAPIWDKLGPKKKAEKSVISELETDNIPLKTTQLHSNCYCGAVVSGTYDCFPITCPACRTVHHARIMPQNAEETGVEAKMTIAYEDKPKENDK
jgi:hypothetical protein